MLFEWHEITRGMSEFVCTKKNCKIITKIRIFRNNLDIRVLISTSKVG